MDDELIGFKASEFVVTSQKLLDPIVAAEVQRELQDKMPGSSVVICSGIAIIHGPMVMTKTI